MKTEYICDLLDKPVTAYPVPKSLGRAIGNYKKDVNEKMAKLCCR